MGRAPALCTLVSPLDGGLCANHLLLTAAPDIPKMTCEPIHICFWKRELCQALVAIQAAAEAQPAVQGDEVSVQVEGTERAVRPECPTQGHGANVAHEIEAHVQLQESPVRRQALQADGEQGARTDGLLNRQIGRTKPCVNNQRLLEDLPPGLAGGAARAGDGKGLNTGGGLQQLLQLLCSPHHAVAGQWPQGRVRVHKDLALGLRNLHTKGEQNPDTIDVQLLGIV
mmetsp:Transcript_26650/g.83586  ORF Transcript_26650/g.83586 Transcript_26650/m.83586 type:complete len:227 (+) Transcript_26650:1727-2407(+)